MEFSDDFLKAYGRASVNFQHLEFTFALLAWELLGTQSHIGQIVTSQLSFRRLCDLVVALFRYEIKEASLHDRLNDIVTRASGLEDRRNTTIHSVWLVADDGIIRRLKIKTGRKGLSVDIQQTETKALDELADAIETLNNELQQLLAEIHESDVVLRVPLPPEAAA